jgi:glutamyl-tRNA synthetase
VRLAPLIQERVATLGEVVGYLEFLFDEPFVVDPPSFDKVVRRDGGAKGILEEAGELFGKDPWTAEALRISLTTIAGHAERKLSKAQAPVRVATMGSSVGLPLFESLEVLGRERTLSRIDGALAELLAPQATDR